MTQVYTCVYKLACIHTHTYRHTFVYTRACTCMYVAHVSCVLEQMHTSVNRKSTAHPKKARLPLATFVLLQRTEVWKFISRLINAGAHTQPQTTELSAWGRSSGGATVVQRHTLTFTRKHTHTHIYTHAHKRTSTCPFAIKPSQGCGEVVQC
jgi:hypothetical protein